MTMPAWLRLFLHRRGWIASPSLAYLGVPFGPARRDLAGEIALAMARSHDAQTCILCPAPDSEDDRDEDDQPSDGTPPCIPDHGVPVPCPGCDAP